MSSLVCWAIVKSIRGILRLLRACLSLLMLSNQRQVSLIFPRTLASSLIKQLILLICLLPAGVAARDAALETVTLQLKYLHQFQFAGYYAAVEKGFYREAGLDVKMKPNRPGLKSPIEEVLSGAAQYGISDNSLVKERLEGKPVVVLANVFQKSPAVWIVREDSGINSLHDLVGKRVMHNPGTTSELLAMLQVEGIPFNKINLVPTSFNIQDLIDGHTDAFNGYVVNEPYILQEQGVPYRLINPFSYGVDSYGDVLFTSESEIENHPERVRAFRLASLKGWQYAMNHPDEIIDLIRTKYNSQKSLAHLKFEAEAMRDLILPDLVAIGHINPGRWRTIAEKLIAVQPTATEANFDLFDGFVYDSFPKRQDLRQLYAVITLVTLIALLFLGLTIWTGRLYTRLKKSERYIQEKNIKLETLNHKLNQAQAITHIGNYVWDLESDRTTWTDELYRITGYPPSSFEPNYERYVNCLHPDDRNEFTVLTQRVLHEKAAYSAKYRIIRPNGELLCIHEQGDVKVDANGKVLGLVGVIQDITERALAEESLRKSEQYNRMLFEESTIGLALCHMTGEIVDINPAFASIIGRTVEESKTLSYWDITPKEYAEREQEQLETLNTSGHYGPYEKEYIHKDGYRVPVRLSGQIIERDGERNILSSVENIAEKKKKDGLIWSQANYDTLTGLSNRRLLSDRLKQEIKRARRSEIPLAVLFIDLDRFKDINDTLGHAKGDEVLVEAAHRISDNMRETDTVSRWGGDEFAVILPELGDRVHVERIAQSIIDELSKPFYVNGDENGSFISASIGIALYPDDGQREEELLKHADQAMYQAKSEGRRRFGYFTKAMQQEVHERLTLTTDLRHALGRKELQVYYQPIVELVSGRIIKAEALLRWKHPTRGIISPSIFIPLAEESGLIHEIGNWVFEESVASLDKWHRQFGQIIQVSVNKSPVQFEHSLHNSTLSNKLTKLGLPGNSITVEITEGLLLKDSPKIQQQLIEYHNSGIEVSIDDFGTGFSALSYLKKFDIDYLKIDRSFISKLTEDKSDEVLTGAIIVMAHKLGIQTIAEGVETTAQRDMLASFGCDYVQGFLYSPPVPVKEFEKMLEKYAWPD